MKLGSIYYTITLLDSIEDLSSFLAAVSFLVIIISSFVYIINKIELSEQLKKYENKDAVFKGLPEVLKRNPDFRSNDIETKISESRLWSKVSKPYVKLSLVLFVLSSITTMIIPEKKDMLIVLSANYLDDKIISNDKAEDWAKEKLDLIDKRVNEFLKSQDK